MELDSNFCSEEREITLFMPLIFKKRGERTIVIIPEGKEKETRPDPVLLKALVRAHLWKMQMEKGKHATFHALCKAHVVDAKYAHMIYRLNYLSPKTKENILNGTFPKHIKLADLKKIPLLWLEQEEMMKI